MYIFSATKLLRTLYICIYNHKYLVGTRNKYLVLFKNAKIADLNCSSYFMLLTSKCFTLLQYACLHYAY